MVDLTLEEFQRNQSGRISRDIIGQSEQHEQKMNANAYQLWENAHQHLVTILRLLDQDYDESCEKANHPLESFCDNDLVYLIHVRLRVMLGDLSRKKEPDETIEIKQRLIEISQKYTDLEQILLAEQELNKNLRAEKSALEAHLSAIRQVHKEGVSQETQQPIRATEYPHPDIPIPNWITTWRETKTFEKTSTVILVMGEMGIALRPTLIKMMAKRLSLSSANKNLDEALNWLITPSDKSCPQLIEQAEGIMASGSSAGGNQPAVLRLTTEGEIAYQVLTGNPPKENEYDTLLRHHSSPEHTILNIQVIEVLKEEGYRIQGKAQSIHLSNGETYIPDIVAVDPKTGEIIFIEVERDVNKDQNIRKTKWMKFYEASNGNLYVFCDNLNCQRAVQGEINLALKGLNYNSFITNLHGIRNGKRAEKDGSIWLTQKIWNK